MLIGMRPTLVPSRPEDPPEDVRFASDEILHVPPGSAVVTHRDDRLLMAITLRNVGSGLAVLRGWQVNYGHLTEGGGEHGDPDDFRRPVRDNYIAAGDVGFWQGAVRDAEDQLHGEVGQALQSDKHLFVDLLYSDEEGLQRFISRFWLIPHGDIWAASVGRHWRLG